MIVIAGAPTRRWRWAERLSRREPKDSSDDDHRDKGARPAEAAVHLARHCIKSEGKESLSGELAIAEVILSVARELRTDLLVTGAYDHIRTIEFLLGGATHELLANAAMPVLMSHERSRLQPIERPRGTRRAG